MDDPKDSHGGFFYGGADIPDDMAEEIYGKEPAAPASVAPERLECARMAEIIGRNTRRISMGGKNSQREEDVEALLGIYDRVPGLRPQVLLALGEIRCTEAAFFVIGIARNWERHAEGDAKLLKAAVVALGKLDNSGQSICMLLQIAEERSLSEQLRGAAAISAESVAARRGSTELSRVRMKLEDCGARQLPEVQRWIKRNELEKKPPARIILQRGGTC
ncbi:MAG: hypothetical protein PHQ80_02550 [Candidatus ainarchaeum sp.]|nr:hypothetical protein [Candidatus ainarchaeum sp.]MDD5096350.1 hypothetical protein [Candidatus ainarchaeum sp.]